MQLAAKTTKVTLEVMILTQITQDVVYDPAHQLTADLYAPAKPHAGIIQIHGGGWFRGDKSKDADWAEQWAELGYFVIVPNYRIAPAAHFPAAQDDMETLYQWLQQADLPFPLTKLAAVGSSAGGNMAAMLGINHGLPTIALSGILDIGDWLSQHEAVVAAEGDTSHFNQQASATINQDGANDPFYKWFITNYIPATDYNAASVAPQVTSTTGPMYLANSLNEFVPTSGLFQMGAALGQHGIPFTLQTLPGSRHAKGYLSDVFPALQVFLASYLG